MKKEFKKTAAAPALADTKTTAACTEWRKNKKRGDSRLYDCLSHAFIQVLTQQFGADES